MSRRLVRVWQTRYSCDQCEQVVTRAIEDAIPAGWVATWKPAEHSRGMRRFDICSTCATKKVTA